MQRVIVFLILLLVIWTNASAEEVAAASERHAAVSPLLPGSGVFKPGSWSLNVYAGRYDVSEEPQFIGVRNKYALGVGMGAELANYPYLGLDLELMFANREYDTPIGPPLWGTIDNDTRVETSALLVGARAYYPANGSLRAYVSAGLGFFRTRMVVSGSVVGFPGTYEDSDSSVEPYYGLGISYKFDNWGLSVDYRHFELKGNFSGFNISNANLGGNMLLAGWRYYY